MDLNIKVNEKNHLDIGGADAIDIAEEFGTPTYVIDENRIRDNYNRFYSVFSKYYPDFKVFYACKANTNLAVMKILESEGCCIDAVSPGEVYTAKKLGFEGERILFTGNNITDDELKFVHDEGVVLNIDSVSALKRLAKIVDPEGVKLSFRVNPMVGAGHHDHCITGGVMTMDIAGKVHQETGIDFEFVDFGGGIGIPYTPDENIVDLDKFAEVNIGLFKEKLEQYDMGSPTMYLEPGRYLVGDASVLLVTVNSVKQSYRKFIGVDAGFHTLLRPAMYESYHHIVDASKMDAPNTQEVDIAGNVCESGDLFARDRPMPDVEEGDVLGILNAGAYGFTMSSNYNSRPLASEVLVTDGNCQIVRERQTFEDLYTKQIIPDHLK